ncbi:hypothetical protein GOBAR_AA18980 [Gossypium barbadense]|uniref:Uncharacterized protein n=1 Tax=Gossypium barbadense TaxID=3634 RepID=A0A2P5XEC2_GOSBA|nr:hypothetical protein GOBAR_AA18980 [Gossypium barbadense]
MDIEFSGVILRPVGTFKNINDCNYQTLKDNCGIDFKKNNEKCIDVKRFSGILMSSGVVLNDDVHWVTFHSGYDFGYLLKLLTCWSLLDSQARFFDLIKIYFLMVYVIQHMMKFCNSLHGGLNKLTELLEVERVGVCYQASSDSLLTSCTFRKLRDNFFNGSIEKYACNWPLCLEVVEVSWSYYFSMSIIGTKDASLSEEVYLLQGLNPSFCDANKWLNHCILMMLADMVQIVYIVKDLLVFSEV